jgi:hypothetical protein
MMQTVVVYDLLFYDADLLFYDADYRPRVLTTLRIVYKTTLRTTYTWSL